LFIFIPCTIFQITVSNPQMLEFCQTVNPNLEDYEADGVSHLTPRFAE
jgi:hypothetical protein